MSGKVGHVDPGVELSYAEYVTDDPNHTITAGTMATWIANSARFVRRPYAWHIFEDGATTYALNCRTQTIDSSNANPNVVFDYVFDNCSSGDSIFVENGDYDFDDTATLATAGGVQFVHIVGESKGARIKPPSGKFAFQIGDSTHNNSYCERLIIEGLMFWPESSGFGSGVQLDFCYQPLVIDCDFKDCATGLQIAFSSKSKFVRCRFEEFTTKGLYFKTSAQGLVTDQYVFQSFFESTVDNSKGMVVEYNVNGILIDGCLYSGTGVNPALEITASYSGIWINNTIFDTIGDAALASNGIEILGSADNGCTDIQFSNVWIQSCWGHGLYVKGQTTAANLVSNAQFDNCLFGNNHKTGVYLENIETVQFGNCRFMNNGLADSAADYEMAQLLINDYAAHLLFDNCTFVGPAGRSNEQYVVIVDCDNDSSITAKFSDCFLSHGTDQAKAYIAYDRADAAPEILYLYAHDTYSRNSGNAGEVIIQIGAQAANQAQNVDCKNGTDGWWL